ncbi:hypothetical protein TELCIR_04192 [Teladorsagia circumcincta]|uniref:DUF4140 domain-containing protein n=1 Tax=Teladorsagia circumcincta TaxID=45464 RepID=A0A2G9UU98_TELCI|nr:hypothetical protein TELCIR_04192 [Teladorsagia circumcincta]
MWPINATPFDGKSRLTVGHVRVDGRGDATILDVQLSEKPATYEETDSPKVAELRVRYEDKLQEVNELKYSASIVQKRVEVLDKLVEGGSAIALGILRDQCGPH